MPNYTHNTLTIYGAPEALHYFYERNRVSKNDIQFMDFREETELSFEKSVSREITYILSDYINKNYILKSGTTLEYFNKNKGNVDTWDLMVSIWGTKWDAIDVAVNLKEIDSNQKLIYRFDTAWCYPENWLITISKIFKNLEFEIKSSNEEDGYDETSLYKFKDGIKTEIETYSSVMKYIEEFGGIEEVVNTLITYCNEENVMITDNDTKEKVSWLTYAKSYIEKHSNEKSYETSLMYSIQNEIYTFFDEYELHYSSYKNKELCKMFVEKIRFI